MDKKPQSSLQSDLSVFDKIAAGKAAAVPFRPALARFSGVLLGALAGLAYASTWRSVNHLALPGIPLGWSLPNLLAGALPFVLSGGLIGAACIWPLSTVVGALLAGGLLLAALVGAFMTSEPAPLSPLMPTPLDVAIVAHFADGWRLACLFKDGHPLVLCKGYP